MYWGKRFLVNRRALYLLGPFISRQTKGPNYVTTQPTEHRTADRGENFPIVTGWFNNSTWIKSKCLNCYTV